MPETTSFEISEKTGQMLDQLQESYGTRDRAATLRRVLAIAMVLTENADEDGIIHLIDPSGRPVDIPLNFGVPAEPWVKP